LDLSDYFCYITVVVESQKSLTGLEGKMRKILVALLVMAVVGLIIFNLDFSSSNNSKIYLADGENEPGLPPPPPPDPKGPIIIIEPPRVV
jgi:hypothetical protein